MKILLVSLTKDPTQQELHNISRLLAVDAAEVVTIPREGEQFMAKTSYALSWYRCLRCDSSSSAPHARGADIPGFADVVYGEYVGRTGQVNAEAFRDRVGQSEG